MQRAKSLEKTWCWERLRAGREQVTEDEMVGWHHRFHGHEFEQTLGDTEGQGGLACCSHGVTKSRTRLSDWTATKGMAPWLYSVPRIYSPTNHSKKIFFKELGMGGLVIYKQQQAESSYPIHHTPISPPSIQPFPTPGLPPSLIKLTCNSSPYFHTHSPAADSLLSHFTLWLETLQWLPSTLRL